MRSWTYQARCARVVDGDTLDLDIDLLPMLRLAYAKKKILR